MARGVNKVILLGHLGKDPELKYFSSGDAYCNLTLATAESWTDKQSGEKKEKTEWHNLVFTRKLAEIAGQYLKKGSQVYVEGSLRTRKWQDKEGQDRYITEIQVNDLQMLGGKGDGGEDRRAAPTRQNNASARQPAQESSGGGGFIDDDIPFMRKSSLDAL